MNATTPEPFARSRPPESLPSAGTPLRKKLLAAGTRFLTARTARQLRRQDDITRQEKIFSRLSSSWAATSFWRGDGVEATITYERFRSTVPLRTYEDFTPAIEQMKAGAADVLWPGRCEYYAVSSGTTAGRTKYLPVTDGMLAHFRQAGLDSLLYYTARVGHSRVFRGRHLFLGGATTLTPLPASHNFAPCAGDLSGITALHLPGWVEKHLYEPGLAIAQMNDWPAKIAAIAARTAHRDISLLAGIPSWVLILAEELRGSRPGRCPHLQALWPHFECFIHGGVPIGPFADELRATLGPTVNFHEVYPASEAFIATQDADPADGLRLMANAGIFYEFLPMADFDESRLAHLGPKAVPLAGVHTGVDYALLLSTPGGLARYVIGDVVRFGSTQPPRLVYVGRTKLQLSAFGEHVLEKELTDALTQVCRRHALRLANFHVAPLFVDSSSGQNRGCHEWWLEFAPDSAPPPPAALLADALDVELKRLNEDYEAKRVGGGLAQPLVRLVPAGHFERWMRARGKWGGQSKMTRCRSDRAVADELGSPPFSPGNQENLHFAQKN